VVKLGSSSIASGEGLALDVVANLLTQIAGAQRAGHEVILVTSGAARLGRGLLEFEGPRAHGPLGVALAASVGQPALMALYRQLAASLGVEVCQILLSKSDLDSAEAMRDVGSVLVAALGRGLLPVVNGNDTTDPRSELDNDQIAVAVAVAAEATRLTLLTNVRAVYADQELRERIERLTPDEARALRISLPGEGRGGMRSKLNAAARAAYCGVETVIGSARDSDVVARSLSPRARFGTTVRAVAGPLPQAQRWVGGIAYRMGTIGINREAEASLRAGSTLFLSGVKRVDGDFDAGAVVELVDVRHPERLIGRGSVALPAAALRLLRALSPEESAAVLSILFRLRHAPAPLDAERFADVADLTRRGALAARQAHAELAGLTAERVATLTDALLGAQPRACAAILAGSSFLTGGAAAGSSARRAVRDMHAVHRDSLVVFGG